MASVNVGDPAPDFTRTAADGRIITLSEFRGRQAVVLFFYPRDNTPVCTQEACTFRDRYDEFVKLGAVVIGVSSDSDDSHRAFAESQRLPYHLIADADGSLRRLFDVPATMFILPGRVTYVIDQAGIVRMKFNSPLNGPRHISEALQVLRELESRPSS